MEPDSIINSDFFTLENSILTIIMFILLILSALISGSEVAFFSLTPSNKEKLRKKGNKDVFILLKKADRLLATILISNNFVNVAIVTISTFLSYNLFVFKSELTIFLVQIVLITFFILLFGEIIPKLYANKAQVKFSIFMSKPLIALEFIFYPLSSLLVKSTSLISKKISTKGAISMDELSKALELTKNSDIKNEKNILEGIVRFSNICVVDVIKPRIEVSAIDLESNFSDIKKFVLKCRYSRIPVYKGNLDTIKGILYVKDLLIHLNEGNEFQWQKIVRDAYFVPETKKINDLLKEFQKKKVHLAIVVDEYGGTSGIVTMEDILEEILGNLNQENDDNSDKKYIKTQTNDYIFEASTLLNDFFKIMDIKGNPFAEIEGEADTLAGLILEIKGELPLKNEIITYNNFKFKVLEVDDRRIIKILCFKPIFTK